MRILTTLAVLAALVGGAAAFSRADAYSCMTSCNPTLRTCTTYCN